ncbi:MAG: thiol:disulfide interchange protein DsbA/DsbL [Betaproteobacteria bacterium]|nr:thiol:disulfide interchange protein DsbA/DsbL [Betaproteobacteria bacterium]
MKIVSPLFSRASVWIAALSFLSLAFLSSSASAAATEGKEYKMLMTPMTTEAPKGKIEVIEFFSYLCPHCADFNPKVDEWKKKLPSDVVFRKIPVNWGRPQWTAMSRAYYALDTIGEDRLSQAVFDAIHKERINLTDKAIFLDWAGKKGVDSQKLADVYDSFTINSKVMLSDKKVENYKVQSVPSFYVNGRYEVNTEAVMSQGMDVVDDVIAVARKDANKK